MNRKDFINNPTFSKLLERASNYSHLIPLNEQEANAEKSAQAPPQTGQPTNLPADNKPTTGTAEKPAEAPKKVDIEGMTYLCTEVAKEMVDLLQSYRGVSPDGRKPEFGNLSLDSIAGSKTMGEFVDGINKALGVIDGVIASSKNADLYSEVTQNKNSAMSEYMNALKDFPGYDPNTDISAGLQKVVKPAIETAKKTMSQMATELASLGGDSTEAPAPKKAEAGFGHFVNFKTFESLLLEQQGDDDSGDEELSGQSPYPVINKMWSLYNKAVKKSSKGNRVGAERIAKKLVKLIATTDEDMKRRILIVRHGIWNAQTDQRYKNFKALSYDSKFDSLDGEVTYAENAIIKTELDSEDLQKITDEIKETDGFLRKFDQLKKEYTEMFDEEKSQLNSKRGNPGSYDAISKGNSFKELVKSFSALQKKSSTTTTTSTTTTKKQEGTPGGLKINGELKQGKGFNQQVKDFQAMVINKFKNTEPFKSSATFKKFVAQGGGQGDGRFGPVTVKIIKAVRAFLKIEIKDTIDQKLVDAIQSAKLNESILFSFDSFMNEQYDADAAKKYLEDDSPAVKSDVGGKKVKQIQNKVSNKEVKDRGGKVSPDEKKRSREEYMAKIKGLTPIDESGRSAVAEGKGILLYGGNNLALRKFDKVLGKVDLSTMKFTALDNPKDTDDINYLVKNETPRIYVRSLEKLKGQMKNIYSGLSPDPIDKDFFKRLTLNWQDFRIKNLSCVYTRTFNNKEIGSAFKDFNGRLYNDLKKTVAKAKKRTNFDSSAISEFFDKWESDLSDYDESITSNVEKAEEDRLSSSMY